MFRSLQLPIRLKILVSALLVIILVVGLITTTMANLFQQDKTFYVRDMASVMSQHVAAEADSLLRGYAEDLQVFADVFFDPEITPRHKSKMINRLFNNYQGFVGIAAYIDGQEPIVVYDENTLVEAGLTGEALLGYRDANPLPLDAIASGQAYIRNETQSAELPVLTIALPVNDAVADGGAVISAWVRLDQLLDVTGRSQDFRTMLIDEGDTLLADTDPQRAIDRTRITWQGELEELRSQSNTRATTVELTRDGVELIAAYTRTGIGGVLAGVEIPRTVAFLTADALLSNLLRVALGLFACAAAASLFFSRRLTRPLEKLSDAANEVGKGRFDVSIDTGAGDEIGLLSQSFNKMTGELREREVALQEAQALLVQSEKMAAFGQLGAGIAHEIKNPLAGILGYAQLALRKIPEGDALREKLKVIEKETKRCTQIISNLMKFARQEEATFSLLDVNSAVEDALAIVDHQMSVSQVGLHSDLATELPTVMGNSNQLQQIIMNFAINAQQAMGDDGGQLYVSTGVGEEGTVDITVRDTGPGMPQEVIDKIFEPFFTTKPAGQGTGLGLSVTYGIVKAHKGSIVVTSAQGEGTTFVVKLPQHRKLAHATEDETVV
ncbi:MAG: ATP-binding protein [Pseudomonadota bacterium]